MVADEPEAHIDIDHYGKYPLRIYPANGKMQLQNMVKIL
jgi:hypothetical protein